MINFDPNKPWPTTALTDLVQAARRRRLVPFIGAGISRLACPESPTWDKLLTDMNDHAHALNSISDNEFDEIQAQLKREQFLTAAEHLVNKLPPYEYGEFIRRTFKPLNIKAKEIYEQLFNLEAQLIITTNYDKLIEDAYTQVKSQGNLDVYTYERPTSIQQSFNRPEGDNVPTLFKIHGHYSDPDRLILTERSYNEVLNKHPGYRLMLSAIFLIQRVLILGFSFEDLEIKFLLGTIKDALGTNSVPHFILLEAKQASTMRSVQLRELHNLEVITYQNNSGTHQEVLKFLKALNDQIRATP